MPGRERRDGGRSADNNNENRNERRGRGRDDRRNQQQDERSQYIERVVTINRVSKVVKGGRRFSFTALVIVGDGQGMVGVGYGKAKEVPAAIQKGAEEARKNFFHVPMVGGTITHPVQGEAAAGIVMMRPAAPGTGVIAGGVVRSVIGLTGIKNLISKSLGSTNKVNIAYAVVEGLREQVPRNQWNTKAPTAKSEPKSKAAKKETK